MSELLFERMNKGPARETVGGFFANRLVGQVSRSNQL
jgi:hypothetical protein